MNYSTFNNNNDNDNIRGVVGGRSPLLVINLKADVDRLEFMSKQLKNDFTRIDAVYGKDDNVNDVSFLCKRFCTDSMIGIMKSHKKCWKYIIDNDLDYGVVLEDDSYLDPNFKVEYKKVLESAKVDNVHWDVILLGCFMCKYKDNDLLTKALMTLRNPFEYEKDINEYLFKPMTWGGTHAYVISKEGAKKMMKLFHQTSYHVDYKMSYSGLDILAVKKLLAKQTTDFDSYNADKIPLLNYLPRMDHNTLNMDFVLTMPAFQIGGVKFNALNIIVIVVVIIAISKIY